MTSQIMHTARVFAVVRLKLLPIRGQVIYVDPKLVETLKEGETPFELISAVPEEVEEMGGGGREGDWECGGCNNRNYAFRTLCNRCKQPRLLVDSNTTLSRSATWLPRIGDWICSRCTNNNYASREKCKKCDQPKELVAMPAVAMPGVSLATYSNYFGRALVEQQQRMNGEIVVSDVLQQCLPFTSNWSAGGAGDYGPGSASNWPPAGSQMGGIPFVNPVNQPLSVPKGWRNGDWMCHCGFHNYSSRSQCKSCNASSPPALGTKRLASDEFAQDWDNKRLNLGNTSGQQQAYPGPNQTTGTSRDPEIGLLTPYPRISTQAASTWQAPMQFPHQTMMPALFGKGAKHWRDGDWMCTNCDNHNYASRSQCNRCKTEREACDKPASQPLTAI